MPWKELTTMSQRQEFVQRALPAKRNISELCREFGISRKTGYKWLERYQEEGVAGLSNRSRRPHHSPGQTSPQVEQLIVAVRDQFPTWGGRKIRAYLTHRGQAAVPSASTITAILRRHARLDETRSADQRPYQRFEMDEPNHLWQMDFKGHFSCGDGTRCHPLTILDDHSRYLLGLFACNNECSDTVPQHLIAVFRRCGLPQRMLMDNGSPWGDTPTTPFTRLTVWLLRLGIQISHGRAYHPQTQGKGERVHRTLNQDILRRSDR